MSQHNNPLQRSHSNPIALLFWSVAYVFNSSLVKSRLLEECFWTQFKLEYFQIVGACKKRGACCEGVALSDQHQQIKSAEEYLRFIEAAPELRCFKPHYDTNGEIACFNCTYLGEDKRCQNYADRPQVCHNYPDSYFITHDKILPGCGYQVRARQSSFFMKNRALKKRIQQVMDFGA